MVRQPFSKQKIFCVSSASVLAKPNCRSGFCYWRKFSIRAFVVFLQMNDFGCRIPDLHMVIKALCNSLDHFTKL